MLKSSLAYGRMLAARGMRSRAQTVLEEACAAMNDLPEYAELREAREFLAHLA